MSKSLARSNKSAPGQGDEGKPVRPPPSAAQFGLERVHGSDEQIFGAKQQVPLGAQSD
jgi:hypothetical protein